MDLEHAYKLGPHPVVNRPLVLAADDNKDNLLSLLHALNRFGFAHVSTLKGQAVLRLAQTYKPDLILLDIVLADLNGIDVIQYLQQNPETRNIPIIAITALARSEEREQLLQMGCSNCLYKPYRLDDLEKLLRQYLTQMPSAS